MGVLALLTSALLLAELSSQQEAPDRFQMEQEPDRFRMEQEPDRFRMEQEPDRFRMEQETPDRFHMEQETPDRFHMEQETPDRFQMEQETPDRLHISQQEPSRFQQMGDGRPIQQAVHKPSQMESEGDKFERRIMLEGDDDDDTFERRVMAANSLREMATLQGKSLDSYRDMQEGKSLDSYRTVQQGKSLDGFRSAAAMDEDDGDNLLEELADLQKEGHTNPHKGSNKKPKKVTFEENVDMKALIERIAQSESVEAEADDDDDALSQWVMVTAEGYEYTSSQEEIEEVLREGSTAETTGYTESSFDAGEEQMRMQDSINASSQRVLGYDSRRMIRYPWYYPYSAMGRVQSGCTGTFIGPRHILTAGHCVYNPYRRSWYKHLNFQRRKNCYPNHGVYYRWKYAITVYGWIRGYRSYDYAVIVVTQSSPSWMGFGYRNPMPRYYVGTAGYPYDKSRQCLWRSYGYLDRRYHNWMTHKCDTYNGMSGGPIYVGYRVYGVHVGSYGYSRNLAVRINKRRFRILCYIKRHYR